MRRVKTVRGFLSIENTCMEMYYREISDLTGLPFNKHNRDTQIVTTNNAKTKDIEKRRSPRIKTIHTVGYALFDENGTKTESGKGQTVNLSQGGALLQTSEPLQGTFIVLMTIDLEGQKIKVQGRIVRTSTSSKMDGFLSGIEFMGSKNKQRKAIVAFVKNYHHQKNAGKTS